MFYIEDLKLGISARVPRYNSHEIPKGNIRQKLKRNCQGPVLRFLNPLPHFKSRNGGHREYKRGFFGESYYCIRSLIHCQGEVGSTSPPPQEKQPLLWANCSSGLPLPLWLQFFHCPLDSVNCDLKRMWPHPPSLDHFIFCSLVPATSPLPSSRSI